MTAPHGPERKLSICQVTARRRRVLQCFHTNAASSTHGDSAAVEDSPLTLIKKHNITSTPVGSTPIHSFLDDGANRGCDRAFMWTRNNWKNEFSDWKNATKVEN
ncbi:hypothetical protein F2P81_025986 [Scophthalmus maximus]|uniref:Uncharacterized protein n=1 Tax=Scophthalmus maximus TaxID=52904 RepID=A0A6A4RR95_SCOMX|nr:hypothetical protein F2P81_025986 [Scophthalmus maximus]